MNYREALEFYDQHQLCIIPIRRADKRPAINGPWATYQQRRSTPEEWAMWWPEGVPEEEQANIGVVTGLVSDLVVIDCDDQPSYEAVIGADSLLEETLTVRTGKGFHIYIRPDVMTRTIRWILNGTVNHVKAEPAYVVAPPSLHASGRHYEFASGNRIMRYPMADLAELFQVIGAEQASSQAKDRPENWADELYSRTFGIGERNDRLTELSGLLRAYFPEARWGLAAAILEDWNAKYCRPPLAPGEVTHTLYSVSRYAARPEQAHPGRE